MKLKRNKSRSEKPDLNMASMIDVVFLLLIFFLVTASFTDTEDILSAMNPLSGASPDQKDFENVRVKVIFDDEFDSTTFMVDGEEFVDKGGLRGRLRQFALANSEVDVIITGDSGVPYDKMILALNTAREVGFRNVTFGIPPK